MEFKSAHQQQEQPNLEVPIHKRNKDYSEKRYSFHNNTCKVKQVKYIARNVIF